MAPILHQLLDGLSHYNPTAVFHRNPNSYPAWCRISQPSTSMLDYPTVAKTIINHPVITIFFGVLCLPSPSHGCVFMALFCHVLPTENPSDLPLSTQLPASHALIRWSSSSLKDNSTEPADWRWFSTATQIVASNEKSGGFQQKHRCHPQKSRLYLVWPYLEVGPRKPTGAWRPWRKRQKDPKTMGTV